LYEDIDYERNAFIGRTQYNAPEIDSVVYFTGDFADVGEFYDVKITAVDGYDLIGEKV
jgi:ribosomal protein S12 methylthiotransferase